jgi:hypothetical protein
MRLSIKDEAFASRSELASSRLSLRWSDHARLRDVLLSDVRALGLRVVKKSSTSMRLSKMSTTYFSELRLGSGYDDRPIHDQAALIAHELYHARQWRHYGRATFATSYVMRPKWRWAIETQAYGESVRAWVAMGATREFVMRYIETRADVLLRDYALGILNKESVRASTSAVLRRAFKIAIAAGHL